MKKLDGRKQRSIRTKKAIVESATETLLKKGYLKTTFKDISENAGVGYGTIYCYFSNKEELVRYLVDDFLSKIGDMVFIEYSPARFSDVRKIVYQQIYSVLKLVETYRSSLKIVWDALSHSEKIRLHWDSITNLFVDRIMEDLSYSLDKGLARRLNNRIIAKSIVSLTVHFLWELVWEKETDIEAVSENLTELYTQGAYQEYDVNS